MLAAIAVALICAALAAGPERVRAWLEPGRSPKPRSLPRVSVPSGHIPDVGLTLHRQRFPEQYPSDMLEDWRMQIGEDNRLTAAKRQLGTELRDVRHRIEIVRATRPHPHYSHDFNLPVARWDEYDALIAEWADLYPPVEAAYAAVTHVNEALRMRRTRANPGQALGVIEDDGIDEAYEAAGRALDALAEPRGEPWQTAAERAEPADPAAVAAIEMLEMKYANALVSAYQDIVRIGLELEHELVEAAQTERDAGELFGRAAAWCDRCLAWANDPKLGLTVDQRRAFRARPAQVSLEATTARVEANRGALRSVKALIDP